MSLSPLPATAVYTADLHALRLLFVSPGISRVTGHQAGELIDQPVGKLFHHFGRTHRDGLRSWLDRIRCGRAPDRPFRGLTPLHTVGSRQPGTVHHAAMFTPGAHPLLVGHLQRVEGARAQDAGYETGRAPGPGAMARLRRWQRDKVTETSARAAATDGDTVALSRREREVLFLIADGLSAREVGQRLCIGESTVVTHRKNLLRKYLARNTAELVKLAGRHYFFP